MKNLFTSEHYRVDIDDNIYIATWSPQSEFIGQEEVKNIINKTDELLRTSQCELVLTDDRERLVIFGVELQNWIANTIHQAFVSAGIKKVAVLMPKELIANLSTNQMIEEIKEMPYNYAIFSDKEDAVFWLKK